METATSLLAIFETNKEQRATFVKSVVDEIREGNKNPLDVHLQVKNMEQIIKLLNEDADYKKYLLEEAQKGGKSFEYHNAKIEIKELGTKYDYSNCGDNLLLELERVAYEANAKLKERQDFLKKAPISGTEIVDPTSGEMATIYPPAKSSTTSVAVTLK